MSTLSMEKSTDPYAWTHKLECPQTIMNDSVKKILCAGTASFLWDDLADVIFTADEVKTIRKNVLLHQLKTGTPNKVVQCMRNMVQMKSMEDDSKNEISKLGEEYKQLDFAVRQKVQKLREIRSKRSEVRTRKNLIKMKYDQTVTQLEDCKKMKLVCQHFMPSTCKDLDPKLFAEMLNLVASLWDGTSKQQVRDAILANLNCIEVPTLWCNLSQNLMQNVDRLMKMETTKFVDTDVKNINFGIAMIYGQQIFMVGKKLWYNVKANNHQQNILELTEKIETGSDNCPDVITWLALALEVCKLEIEQKHLGEEVSKIREYLNENSTITFDLAELISEIQDIDQEMVTHAEYIQQSLIHLKSLPEYITKVKDEMSSILQEILALRNSYCDYSLENCLRTEIDLFHDYVQLKALRKVKLKGDVGVYRHKSMCITEASVVVANSQTSNIIDYFPMVHIPIYSLIECYKQFSLMFFHTRFNFSESDETVHIPQLPVSKHGGNNCNIVELLSLSKTVNTKTKYEINEFNRILNDWVYHTVEKAMNVIENSVDDATFAEWVERYDLLLYIIQKSNGEKYSFTNVPWKRKEGNYAIRTVVFQHSVSTFDRLCFRHIYTGLCGAPCFCVDKIAILREKQNRQECQTTTFYEIVRYMLLIIVVPYIVISVNSN